jgi:TRAP-type C4-dicarboxylate transport system permease small subunit
MKKKRYTTIKNISALLVAYVFLLCSNPSFALAIDKVQLNNPLKVDSIGALLVAIINIVMILMVPVIVFFIIYAGFKYVTARGNASQVEEASQSLLYAILGGVLILGAFAIAAIIQNIVTAFQNTP